MAIKALNSVAGFSVGEVPANIILANGDITSNNGTFTANISAGNVLTNNLLYANGTAWDIGGIPGGSNTQVQFNDAGEFGGVSNFTFDKATNILTVTGNIAGTNVNAGNLLTANFVTGVLTTANQPNVTSVGTLTGLVVGNGTANVTFVPSGANGGITATGNITAANFIGNVVGNISGNIVIPGSNTGVVFNDDGNANTSTAFTFNKSSNLVTASGNVSAGNLITGGVVSATGNVSGANLTTAGLVSATGNVSGGNITTGGVVSATGNITGANVTANSFVFASNIVSNASTNDTRIELGSSSGIIAITSAGNSTQFGPSGQITLGGASQIVGGTFGGSGIKLDTTQTDIFQNRGGNVTVQLGTGGTIANTWTFAQSGAFIAPGNITTTANANVGNLNTGGQVVATGNVTGGNLVTTGTANIGNLLISGTVQGNLIPSVSNTYSLGNGTNYWKDLFLSGNTITLGDQSVSSNANGVSLSNTVFMTTLSVSGNANVGNLGTAGLIIATGNVSGGNITTIGVVSATGNVSGGNLTTAGNLSVTGNANIGNIGTAGLVVATGNVSGGNLTTGGIVTATGNIETSANVVTDLIVGKTASVTITAVGSNQNVNLTPTGTGTVNVGNFIISNVATPLASTDAATKQYVDDVAQGLHTHDSCNAATQTTLASISGGTVTYNNGTSGVGATLTTTGTFTTIDGVTLSVGMRILVKNEVTAANNGIYDVTSSTVLTRSADFNTPTEMAGGDFTFVTAGTLYDNTGWVMPDPVTTVGTSPVVWVQFSGAGTYTAGTGLALNGTEFSIANTTVTAGAYGNGDYNATFTVNSQGQLSAAANVAITANAANLTGTTLAATIVNSSLTSVGTLTSLAVTGNTTSGNVYANAGTIGASLLTGTLTTAAQPNVTSVGSLTGLTVTGLSNLGSVGNVAITGGTSGQVLSTNGAGGLSFITIGTAGVSNGNSNVAIATAGGNVTTSVAGNANILVVTGTGILVNGDGNVTGNLTAGNIVAGGGSGGNITGANLVSANFFTGTLTTAAQPNITSVGTLTTLAVSGNANLGNVATANFFSGAGNSLSNIQGANVSGEVSFAATANAVAGANVSGQVANALVAGTVYTNAQPNITSVGTLTGITSTGTANFIGASNVALGPVGNVHITGGTSGQVLSTDGSGTLSFITIGTAGVSNGNSNVAIATAGGNVTTSVAGNANILVVTGTGANITGYANISGSLSLGGGAGGNLTGANNVSANTFTGNLTTNAQPNITSVGTLTSLAVTGNISSGNADLGNAATANFFIGSGNNLSNIQGANVTGTVSSASTAGTVTSNAQANITSVGILTSLTVTGNISSGNANLGNLATANFFSGAGNNLSNIQGANVSGQVGNALVAGTVYTNAQPNITSVGTLSSLDVTGNLSAGNLIGALANGNSNVNIPSANGNINLTASGNTTLVITGTGANIAGTLNVTGNLVAGNLTTGGAGGNVSGANVVSANTLVASVGVQISNSAVYFGNITTSSTTANQTIATLSLSGYVTGVEYLVKGVDATGAKYSVATVVSVTNGTTADFSTFATVNLGGSTGTLSVNIVSGNIALQVTPASSNSTVWTTQYRVI